MKPHPPYPKLRKTIKWGGAAVAVLLVGVWIGSAWFGIWWTRFDGTASRSVVVCGGSLVLHSMELPPARWQSFPPTAQPRVGLHVDANRPAEFHWWTTTWHSPAVDMLTGPLWPIILAVLYLVVGSWRQDTLARRRDRLKLCPKCNYDRTGLAPGVVCPECGAAASRP